jgi:EAL domain-containing protein (putative c-di-GMP-specific phosphodiesterase class I)
MGGDEFLVILRGVATTSTLRRRAAQLASALAQPIEIGDITHVPTASVGGVLSRLNTSPDDLIRDADAAMYEAKARGRSQVVLFGPATRSDGQRRLSDEAALRHAIKNRLVTVAYQPIVDIREQRLVGVEALARWNDEQQRPISPETFIGLAEETGLILPLGEHILETVTAELQTWSAPDHPLKDIWAAVNFSGRQLADRSVVALVKRSLAHHSVEPWRLHAEITETMLMSDLQSAIVTLKGLRSEGITITIDDFGTGYSSLSYLARLPIQGLKVDRSFVAALGTRRSSSSIVKAIIEMGRALAMDVVAEGVETERQAQMLTQFGCSYGQGWLWQPALSPSELVAWAAQPHTAKAVRHIQ